MRNTITALIFSALLFAKPCLAGGPPPVILVQPLDVSVLFLNTASLSVVALSGTTMTYQWYKDGTNIPGATSATYSLLTIQNSDAGNYYVVVQNGGGSVTSATVTVTVLSAPTIVTQPASQMVTAGGTATFSVTPIGTSPFTYQWYLNASSLGNSHGARTASYSKPGVGTSDTGSYFVVVGNSYGSVTSSVAALTVGVPAAITTQPSNQSVLAGQNATFNVTASGTEPLGYQWNFNGLPLVGATSSNLTLTGVLTAFNGNYSVVVANGLGSITSAVATLSVTLPQVSLSTAGNALLGKTTNGFSFQFGVPVGVTYVVLASVDLRNWTPIYTNVAANATAAFNDAAALKYDHRYYKVMVH